MDSYAKTWLLLAVTMVVWAGPSAAATIFTVGDNTGWTILGSPNYTQWASGKTFGVGDTLLFKYNNIFHNVLEVKAADFTACNNNSAIKEYRTGEDSIIIETAGHHYFICGVPGHCEIGQKVDVLAVDFSAAPSSSPPSNGAGDRLAAGVSVFISGLITAASCAFVLSGFLRV